jgi:RNA polymerase sigma factor (sigma-70 family)
MHMGSGQRSGVLRYIRKLAGARAAGTLTDGQLLERFIFGQDEAAFEAILQRHGPMVLRVCQRVLGDVHDAEDAFQATFLVLVCKAGAIAKRDSAGSWLYGVAQRIALRARARAERQRTHAKPLQDLADARQAGVPTEAGRRELCRALDEELNRLPEKNRAPLVLCYLEGKSRNEAAQELCWPLGTLQRRLTRGQELLHRRLVRRGVTLSAALAAAELSPSASPAAVPGLLTASTLKAAILLAAGKGAAAGAISAQAAALTQATLRALLLAKAKTAVVLVLAISVIGAGVGTATQHVLAQRRSAVSQGREAGLSKPERPHAPPEDKAVSTVQQSAVERNKDMTVTGRVLDPDGKPAPHVEVAVSNGK